MNKKIVYLTATVLLAVGVFFLFSEKDALTYNGQSKASRDKSINERIKALKRQIAKDKYDYIAIIDLGNIYLHWGDKKRALRLFKRGVEINPDYPLAHFFAGKAHYLMQEKEKALRELDVFRKKMRLVPYMDEDIKDAYIESLHEISEVYFDLKEYRAAKEIIDEILQLDPAEQLAYYNLGVYYYTHKRNRSKAYRAFLKAIEIDPDTHEAGEARYAIEFMRSNPDPRLLPDFSFIDRVTEEY